MIKAIINLLKKPWQWYLYRKKINKKIKELKKKDPYIYF